MSRFLKPRLNGKVSSETTDKINKFLENVLDKICVDLNKEFEAENNQKKFYGLRKCKIIQATLFLNLLTRVASSRNR